MKKSAVIILFGIQYFVFGLNTGFAQWNPLCAENPNMGNKAVFFLDDTTGFVVGGTSDTINHTFPGYILRTFDGGQNWDTTMISNGAMFNCISFPSRDTGYVAGWGGLIYKTTDGGNTWINMPQSYGSNIIWMSTYFINNNTGYFSCESQGPPIVIKTVDGGQTWTRLYDTASNFVAGSSIYIPCSDTGYISTYGFIYKTTDAGNSWSHFNTTDSSGGRIFSAIHFLDGSVGFAVGNINGSPNSGSIAKTMDGGQHWHIQDYYNIHDLYAVDFSSPSIGYAVGNPNVFDQISILATRDGGVTWWPQVVNYPFSSPLFNSVSAPSDSIAYATCPRGVIYKTTNGGGALLGITEPEFENNFNVFPNPTSDMLKFHFGGATENRTIIIFDQLGKEIQRKETNENEIEFHTENFAKGLYFYQVEQKGGATVNGKFIIQ